MALRDPLEPPAARDQLEGAERLRAAERLLGHNFANPGLLTEALTHRSATQAVRRGRKRTKSNERLEFMGDRVLGLLIAEWLIERFPDEQEGALGPRHAHLVSRRVLAEIAERAGLSEALAIGPSEARAGVGQLANVLADAMEAAIGAMYLDGGLDAARRFVRAAWAAELDSMGEPPKDPKTELQEWLMARGLPLPVYQVASRTGPPHRPEFVMQVLGAGKAATGTAGSKRLAEREAAANLLAQLQG
ncbi:MAG: ribonuclease III [Acetobacteraceae bacterium]|nr:ribonuclease III [Acetobacteraceae bacterium]